MINVIIENRSIREVRELDYLLQVRCHYCRRSESLEKFRFLRILRLKV